jgi:hypothetical protein
LAVESWAVKPAEAAPVSLNARTGLATVAVLAWTW